jgi:hypothetical protein
MNPASVMSDSTASGAQDGNSWASAYRYIGTALGSCCSCADIDEIWIADGTYKPYFEIGRTNYFNIRPGVKIYGRLPGK